MNQVRIISELEKEKKKMQGDVLKLKEAKVSEKAMSPLNSLPSEVIATKASRMVSSMQRCNLRRNVSFRQDPAYEARFSRERKSELTLAFAFVLLLCAFCLPEKTLFSTACRKK